MKKVILVVLIAIMFAGGLFVLTGCGEKEIPMVTITNEYTSRNVKVSIGYPEGSSYRSLDVLSEEGKENRYSSGHEPDIQLLSDRAYIEVNFEGFTESGKKNFAEYKDYIKNNQYSNEGFTETTVNARGAFYRTYQDNIILSIDMTDLMESPDASGAMYLKVNIMSLNMDEVTGVELFGEAEVKKIINSIKIENMD